MHISTAKSRVVWIEKRRFPRKPRRAWPRAPPDHRRGHTDRRPGANRRRAERTAYVGAMPGGTRLSACAPLLSTALSTGVYRGGKSQDNSARSPVRLGFARSREPRKLADSCTACPQVCRSPGRHCRRRRIAGLSGRLSIRVRPGADPHARCRRRKPLQRRTQLDRPPFPGLKWGTVLLFSAVPPSWAALMLFGPFAQEHLQRRSHAFQ